MAVSVTVTDEKISSLSLLPPSKTSFAPVPKKFQAIANELHAYFENPKHRFSLPLQVEGTPFQKSVWKAIQAIPSGKVASYQDLAQKLKTSPRAIGNACRSNRIVIIIPCHRVVAKNGMGGYNGQRKGEMLNIKSWLLQHEGLELL